MPTNSQIKLLKFIHKQKEPWVSILKIQKVNGYKYDDIFELYSENYINIDSPNAKDNAHYKIQSKGISAIENSNQSRINLLFSITAAVASVVSIVVSIILAILF